MFNAFVARRLALVAVVGIVLCGCDGKRGDEQPQGNPSIQEIVDPYSGKSLMGIVHQAELVGFRRLRFEIRGGEGHRNISNPTDPNLRIFAGEYVLPTNVHVFVDPAAGDKTYVNFGYDGYGSRGNNIHYDRPTFLEIVVRDAAVKKQWETYIANIADDISVGAVESIAVSANYCLAELREDFSDARYVATVRKKNVRIVIDSAATPTPAYQWDCYANTLAITVQTPEEAERWQKRLGR